MIIRTATKNDVKILQNLNDEVFIDNSKYDPDLKKDWAQSRVGKKYFTDVVNDANSICLIAEENCIAIGYIAAAPKKFGHRLSKYIEVENMGVTPNFRSKGVGAQLIHKCLKIAKGRGYQKVYVIVYFENTKAVNFYERCGLDRIDICLEKDIS